MQDRNNFEIRLLVKGRPVVEYGHNGKTFVEGREGSEFEIEFTNRTNTRVEAVLSVDGLSITDGQAAGPNSAGYLVDPHKSVVIPGWKRTDEEVANFFFAGKAKSYSTQMTGSSANNGVIGVMVFAERVKAFTHLLGGSVLRSAVPMGLAGSAGGAMHFVDQGSLIGYSATSTTADASASPFATGMNYTGNASTSSVEGRTRSRRIQQEPEAAQVNQLGTGFGRAQEFHTEVVQFERGDLASRMVIYYDNARGLKARGIEVGRKSRTQYTAQEPQAFPGMGCTPPPGWRG